MKGGGHHHQGKCSLAMVHVIETVFGMFYVAALVEKITAGHDGG